MVNIKEQWLDEIIKYAFLLKQDFAKDARERDEFAKRMKALNPWSKQVSTSLSKEEKVLKYKGKTIRKRKDGRYFVRYYDSNHKQHSVYGKTQAECLKKLKTALNSHSDRISSEITLESWLKKWLDLYKAPTVKESTLKQLQRYSAKLAPLFNFKLKEINALILQEFLTGIKGPRAREHYFDILHDCLDKAVKNEFISKNPCDRVNLPTHRAKETKALTIEEEQRFIASAKKDPYGLQFLLCLFQGLRIGETQLLTQEDIDIDHRTLRINKALNDCYKADTPKTATSNRILPLFARTVEALAEMPFKMAKSDKQVYGHFRQICEMAQIDGITTHSLRHTFATRCAEAGITPKTTQKWLGHSSITITLNVYTHVNSDFEAKERGKFDTFFDT